MSRETVKWQQTVVLNLDDAGPQVARQCALRRTVCSHEGPRTWHIVIVVGVIGAKQPIDAAASIRKTWATARQHNTSSHHFLGKTKSFTLSGRPVTKTTLAAAVLEPDKAPKAKSEPEALLQSLG